MVVELQRPCLCGMIPLMVVFVWYVQKGQKRTGWPYYRYKVVSKPCYLGAQAVAHTNERCPHTMVDVARR